MPLFPFFGEEKKKDLDEIKRLALGGENSLQNPSKTAPQDQTPPSGAQNTQTIDQASLKKDVAAFKEEQKIFTQVTSVKELAGEQNYAVPKELNPLKNEEKKQENQIPPEISQEAQAEKKETNSQKTSSSAFDKLLSLKSSNLTTDEKKETITSKDFANPSITPEKIVQQMDPNTGSVSMKSSLEKPPEIKIVQNEEKTESTQKEYNFAWEDSSKSEEPQENDFPEEKKDTVESVFARQKKIAGEAKENTDKVKSLKTPIDEMFELLDKFKRMETGQLADLLHMDSVQVEKIAKIFEEDGVLEIEYPTSLTKKPMLILKNPAPSKLNAIPRGEVLDTYIVEVDFVPAKISIILSPEEARPIYALEMPGVGRYTRLFLSFIKDEVAETMPIEIEEIVDPKKSKKLKERFFFELNAHLSKYFPALKKELLDMLSGVLLHEMYGLGDIELLMGDDMLEEVGINSSKTPITVYHRVHGWLKTNLMPGSEEEINNFSSQIGRKVGREITTLSPILDAHLLSGDRVNATLFPISSEGNTLTIRRFARKPWTIVDFIGKAHTMNSEMAALLWLAMQYELNILIAGGTASGKTSALNSLLALVPTYHRIISIEDVREIVLPKYLEWNWVPMVTRSPNPEGLGEVTMLDLMVTSLRMRPDRIIVGEIRRKKEAEVLMEAIETGHSIYSTLHANSGYQVLRRLAEAPMSIPLMQIELLDLVVVQYRDRKTNKRRTYEIAEIEQTSSGQGLQVNTIYKWVPRSDSWEKLNKPTKIVTLLNLHTGMTEDDIDNEIKDRKEILEWLKRIDLNDLDSIGFVVKLFYSDPNKVKQMAKDNIQIEKIIELMEEGTEKKEEEDKQKEIKKEKAKKDKAKSERIGKKWST